MPPHAPNASAAAAMMVFLIMQFRPLRGKGATSRRARRAAQDRVWRQRSHRACARGGLRAVNVHGRTLERCIGAGGGGGAVSGRWEEGGVGNGGGSRGRYR